MRLPTIIQLVRTSRTIGGSKRTKLPRIQRAIGSLRQRLLFNRHEVAGALGDLGTFIPLLLGMVTQCGLQLGPALFFAGIVNMIAGLSFAIPMVVQPMKAIAALAIAERMSEAQIIAAGIITGGVVLLLVFFGLIDRLHSVIPRSVVRGLQLALGLKLLLGGFWMVIGTQTLIGRDSILLGLVCLGIALLLWRSVRMPAALVIFVIGLASVAGADFNKNAILTGTAWHIPQLMDTTAWLEGFWRCAIPQIPLTLLNSVVAVCALSCDLFPRRPALPRKVALSVGLMNLLCCPLGAMPMCHGAGGLAAQYRFGARSGGSLVILGVAMTLLGLLSGDALLAGMQYYPQSVLGVLLGCSAFELARVCRDQTAWREIAAMLITAATCLLTNMALGFLFGCVVCIMLDCIGQRFNSSSKNGSEGNELFCLVGVKTASDFAAPEDGSPDFSEENAVCSSPTGGTG